MQQYLIGIKKKDFITVVLKLVFVRCLFWNKAQKEVKITNEDKKGKIIKKKKNNVIITAKEVLDIKWIQDTI